MFDKTRRDALKSSATTLAMLTGFSGTAVAGPTTEASFEELIKSWIERHGQLVDFSTKAKRNPKTRVLIYEFEDGTVKTVVEKREDEYLVHKVDGEKYKESWESVNDQAKRIANKKDINGMTVTSQDVDTGSSTQLANTSTQSVPTVDPGSNRTWIYANGSSSWTDEELVADDTYANASHGNFKAESMARAAVAGGCAAESIVYREWQVGYNSNDETPVMEVDIDFDISGHLTGLASDGALKARVWLENITTGEYAERFVINKTSWPADNYNNRIVDNQTFTMEARPGHKYRIHAQAFTKVIALWTSAGEAWFRDTMLMNNWVKVDEVDLRWL